MRSLAALLLLALLLTTSDRAWSQANTGPVAPADLCQRYPGSLSAEERSLYLKTCQPAKNTTENTGEKQPPAFPAPVLCSVAGIKDEALAKDLQEACVADLKHAFAYSAAMRNHNVQLYKWQAGASDDMRILVWVVVLAGLAMAVYQLAIVMQIELWRARRRNPGEAPNLGEQKLELGLGKVQLTSSVTGVVVLAISIAFLYLYLTEVYPIKPPPG